MHKYNELSETLYLHISPISKPNEFQNSNSVISNSSGVYVFDDELELSTDNDGTVIFEEPIFNLNYRQKHVLEWMIEKESQYPYGGIIGEYD